MNCRNAELWIQRRLDGGLSLLERQTLEAHLASCPHCQTVWEDHRRLSRMTADWTRRVLATEEPGEAFTAQVLGRIAARPTSDLVTPRIRWRHFAFAGAIVLLLVILSFLLSPRLTDAVAMPSLTLACPTASQLGTILAQWWEQLPRDMSYAWAGINALPAVSNGAWGVLLAAFVVNAALAWRAYRLVPETAPR